MQSEHPLQKNNLPKWRYNKELSARQVTTYSLHFEI